MKTKFTILALGIFLIVGSALAQTNPPQSSSMPRWKNAKGANELKLTDEQKKDVQKIKYDLMQKQIDLRAKIAHAGLDYRQLASADSPDEDAISAKIDEIAKLQVQMKKNLLDGWFAVNKILTPDQQKIWKKVLQHPLMARRHMMMRMQMNHGMGNGMMQWRQQGMGFGPMLNGGPTLGAGSADGLESSDMDFSGPMADLDILSENGEIDNLDLFDFPMMEHGDMMMGQGQFLNHGIDTMNPNTPDPTPSK